MVIEKMGERLAADLKLDVLSVGGGGFRKR